MNARRLRRAVRVLCACAAVLQMGCRGHATRADCDAMVDRYLDLTLATDKAFAQLPPDQLAVAREMKRAVKKGDPRFAKVELHCEAEVSKKERDCAMQAATAAEWEACIR